MTDDLAVEATGESPREAKWNALRELERLAPRLDKAAVRFQVLSEGKRGLLGVGAEPARVLASVPAAEAVPEEHPDDSEAAASLREMLERVTGAMGLSCRVEIEEAEDRLTATCEGGDLGLLIGKHGQTIDAVQTLASAIVASGTSGGEGSGKRVVVDAAGYRARRREVLEALALRSAEQALREGARVPLEPMSAAERRIVHEAIAEMDGVATVSEGESADRHVVVLPA